ncbi:hypothetical protein EDD18DRAFT_1026424, partial [Armillaria luteobubalina]
CYDTDRVPLYICLAISNKSVLPCKIRVHPPVLCSVTFGGREIACEGHYNLLPF